MNKEQYINQLKTHLSSLSQQEKDEAMEFYEEYLSDLDENNPDKIETLDDPAQVAAQIKAEAAIKGTQNQSVKNKKGISAAWMVLLGVLALPIGLPLAIAIAAIAFSLIMIALSLVISLFAVVVSVIGSGIVAFISGTVMLFTVPAVGIFYLGCGLLCLGIGYLLLIGVYDLSKRIFGWIARFFNNIRKRMQNRQSKKNGGI